MAVGALCILAMFTVLGPVGPCPSEMQVVVLFGGVFAFGSGLVMNLLWVIVKFARSGQQRVPSEQTTTSAQPSTSKYPLN